MWEIKVFTEKDSEKYKALLEFLAAGDYGYSTMPVLPKAYLNQLFSRPFRVGKKQARAVLDNKGLHVFIAPKGAEKLARLYCDALKGMFRSYSID